jgi:hypothetical protein
MPDIKPTPEEEKRAFEEGDDMIEMLAMHEFAEQEVMPGYRMIDAIGDALKEAQGDCEHEWYDVPAGKTCKKCHLHLRDPFFKRT